MRAAPPFQVSLRRFGLWRGAVCALASSSIVTLSAWLVARSEPLGWAPAAASAMAAMTVLALSRSLLQMPPADLRWNGRAWHLDRGWPDPLAGDIVVALDLGGWMLLRFHPCTGSVRQRTIWLPVQRRGLESHWHALRCSVYSPRPVLEAEADAAAGA